MNNISPPLVWLQESRSRPLGSHLDLSGFPPDLPVPARRRSRPRRPRRLHDQRHKHASGRAIASARIPRLQSSARRWRSPGYRCLPSAEASRGLPVGHAAARHHQVHHLSRSVSSIAFRLNRRSMPRSISSPALVGLGYTRLCRRRSHRLLHLVPAPGWRAGSPCPPPGRVPQRLFRDFLALDGIGSSRRNGFHPSPAP